MEKRLISKTFIQGRGGGVVDSTETYRRASWQGQRLVRCSNRRGYNGEYISVKGVSASRDDKCEEGKKTYDAVKLMINVCKEGDQPEVYK